MRTYKKLVGSKIDLLSVVSLLIESSQWFSVEPFPDDEYEVTVKAENQEMLDRPVDHQARVENSLRDLITAPGINDHPLSIVCDDSFSAPIVLRIVEQEDVDQYNLDNEEWTDQHDCPFAAGNVIYDVSDGLPGVRSHCEEYYTLETALEGSFNMHQKIQKKVEDR